MCDTVERAFRPVAEQKGVAFQVQVAPGTREMLVTDEQRLHQILNNLLSNACKFTAEGSVSLVISPAGDDGMAFTVTDTGVGIRGEQLDVIFEAFRQADGTTSRRFGGTGLGLTISRELAGLLGGEITVESQEGRGSTFTLVVPARSGPAGALDGSAVVRSPAGRTAVPAAVGDDPRDLGPGDRALLIVEPDPEAAVGVVETVRSQGLRCVVATRPDDAVALVRQQAPAAVVLGSGLGDAAGRRTLEALKRHPSTAHVPVHVVSGPDERGRALAAGAAAHFAVPVTAEGLEALVAHAAAFAERAGRRALVVGPDGWREKVAELIGGADLDLVPADSVAEAVAAMKDGAPDCVLLDLRLPEGVAFGVLEALRATPALHDVPVVARAEGGMDLSERAALRGYADVLVVRDGSDRADLVRAATLALHRPWSALPEEGQRLLAEPEPETAGVAGRTVLVVDDDERNIFALRHALALRGARVLVAEKGHAGLAALRDNPDVDLVLMDVMMPELDGYETMREIRRVPELRGLPVIALTAKAMAGDREKSIEAGASDYIAKPVEIARLLELIRMWLPG